MKTIWQMVRTPILYTIWLFWSHPRFTSTFGVMKFTKVENFTFFFHNIQKVFIPYQQKWSRRPLNTEVECFLVYIIMNSVFLIEWRRLLNIICITPSISFGPALESRTTEDMKCRIFAEWSTFQLFFLQMCGSIFKFLINYQSWQFLPCPENSYRERVMKFIIYVPFTPKNASY